MKESIVPESACPKCSHVMDRAMTVKGDNATPEPGSLSICIRCGAVSKFRKDLRLQGVSQFELQKIKQQDPEAYNLIKQALLYIKQQSSKGNWID